MLTTDTVRTDSLVPVRRCAGVAQRLVLQDTRGSRAEIDPTVLGRAPAFEVLVGTSAVRNLIREGKNRQIRNMIATGHREGMPTLEASINALVRADTVTYEEAVRCSAYPEASSGHTPRPAGSDGRTGGRADGPTGRRAKSQTRRQQAMAQENRPNSTSPAAITTRSHGPAGVWVNARRVSSTPFAFAGS